MGKLGRIDGFSQLRQVHENPLADHCDHCVLHPPPNPTPTPSEAFRCRPSGFCPEQLIVLLLAVLHDERAVILALSFNVMDSPAVKEESVAVSNPRPPHHPSFFGFIQNIRTISEHSVAAQAISLGLSFFYFLSVALWELMSVCVFVCARAGRSDMLHSE